MEPNDRRFDWQVWLVTSIAAAAVVLTLVNIAAERSLANRAANVLARQTYIEESVVLSRLNEQIIEMLASLSADTKDTAIREMLASHGVTFSVRSPSTATEASPQERAK